MPDPKDRRRLAQQELGRWQEVAREGQRIAAAEQVQPKLRPGPEPAQERRPDERRGPRP